MRAQELRNTSPRPEAELADHVAGAPAHPLPEGNGFVGIVPGLGHQAEPNVIRFTFLDAAEWQGSVDAVCHQDALDRPGVHPSCCRSGYRADLRNLLENATADPLDAMSLDGVGHLMAHHRGHAGLVLRMLENAGEQGYLPARQAEGVDDLVVLDQGEFPIVARLVGRGGDPYADGADHRGGLRA